MRPRSMTVRRSPGRARGREGDAGADPRRAPRRADPRVRRPAPGGGRRRHDRSAARPSRYMSRGQLVPDDTMVRVLPRPARPARRAAIGAILDGFPGRGSRPRPSTTALAEAGRRVDRAIFIDLPTRGPRRAGWPTAGSARADGHVYNLASNPPQVAGVCDLDGSELVQRADDDEATVRARMDQQIPPLARGRRPLPRAGDPAGTSTGGEPIDGRQRATLLDALGRPAPGARLRWSPASRAARSRRCARPGGSWPRSSPSSRPSSSPASRPATSIGSPSATSAAAGAVPSFKGYGHRSNPFPASLCISIDDEVVHGIPGDRADPRRPDRLDRRRRDLRRLARRRRPDVRRRRASRPRSSRSSTRRAWR